MRTMLILIFALAGCGLGGPARDDTGAAQEQRSGIVELIRAGELTERDEFGRVVLPEEFASATRDGLVHVTDEPFNVFFVTWTGWSPDPYCGYAYAPGEVNRDPLGSGTSEETLSATAGTGYVAASNLAGARNHRRHRCPRRLDDGQRLGYVSGVALDSATGNDWVSWALLTIPLAGFICTALALWLGWRWARRVTTPRAVGFAVTVSPCRSGWACSWSCPPPRASVLCRRPMSLTPPPGRPTMAIGPAPIALA